MHPKKSIFTPWRYFKFAAHSSREEKGEKNKAIVIAKSLLSKGLDLQLISEATGLTEQELKTLQ